MSAAALAVTAIVKLEKELIAVLLALILIRCHTKYIVVEVYLSS